MPQQALSTPWRSFNWSRSLTKMGTLKTESGGEFEYQWASDVGFDGIRLEVLTTEADMLFDVSVPEQGPMSVNTFSNEVAADLILAALDLARQRR
ncbi:hypothetical protein ACFODL_06240 [Phenylobacterium terrae]|uniref:Uncharacterized protein n=1 Tax=Phenylobacterium terrae TaxID=2665495 RepID=A0ABW4N672_9CAUL